jgi:hypothetical protein
MFLLDIFKLLVYNGKINVYLTAGLERRSPAATKSP